MDADDKCTMIHEMVDRIVAAERSCAGWTADLAHGTTKCEKERASEMLNRSIITKNTLWRDFEETLEEIMHD